MVSEKLIPFMITATEVGGNAAKSACPQENDSVRAGVSVTYVRFLESFLVTI
jgi:hypothetical protein